MDPSRYGTWLALGICCLLFACDIHLRNDRLGVTIDEAKRIHILYQGCAARSELVRTVELLRVHGSLDGGDDVVAWAAHTTDDRSVAEFVVGDTRVGYEEDVPMSRVLTGRYTVVLTTSLTDTAQGIEVAKLRVGKIDTGSGFVSRREFDRRATEQCRS